MAAVVLGLTAPLMTYGFFARTGLATGVLPYESLIPSPQDHAKWLVASEKEIFEKSTAGNMERVDGARGSERIRKLIGTAGSDPVFFALTDREIIRYRMDQGTRDRVFEFSSSEERLLSFATVPGDTDHWLAGTSSGLQESDDAGRIWYPFPYFRNQSVELLKCTSEACFLGSGSKLYRSDNLSDFKQVLTLPTSQEIELAPESSPGEESEDFGAFHPIFYDLCFSSSHGDIFELATARGIFESHDQGLSWQRLSGSGLTGEALQYLTRSDQSNHLYAANHDSVFEWISESARWKKIEMPASLGLVRDIRGLGIKKGEQDSLVVLTSQRFFEIPVLGPEITPQTLSIPSPDQLEKWEIVKSREPSIHTVHKKVIGYADVGNGKIHRWQAGSRLAALLPTFSFGKDLSHSTSLSTSSGKFFEGPEDYTRGWDADVSWDLGDFIWSSAQTSIDSRQKLMVELRQDLLAEATRLYFERRRLQESLYLNSALDDPSRREIEIHIEELTALLDGMTGGWYSQQLRKMHVGKIEHGQSQGI